VIRSCAEIIGKKECDNRHFASGSCSICAFEASKKKVKELDSKLSGKNDKFREQETRVVD